MFTSIEYVGFLAGVTNSSDVTDLTFGFNPENSELTLKQETGVKVYTREIAISPSFLLKLSYLLSKETDQLMSSLRSMEPTVVVEPKALNISKTKKMHLINLYFS